MRFGGYKFMNRSALEVPHSCATQVDSVSIQIRLSIFYRMLNGALGRLMRRRSCRIVRSGRHAVPHLEPVLVQPRIGRPSAIGLGLVESGDA